ncbi:MAG: ABC transporter permease subunit [Candidatus Omnitrophica bacterium]|nr:ABC transporter permease subunit [Candidatus Omnitrophota bacterium]MBD3269077.1 ABC transporter permease subunit [Candidatus Omnitrophota bacterium]
MYSLCKAYRFEIICVLPILLYLFVFTFLPVAGVFKISFTDSASGDFTFDNFKILLGQQEFHTAFINTLIIALGSLTLEIGLGLLLAMVLSFQGRRTGFLKSFFMLPLAIPTVVAAVIMSYMFSSSGWVNRILLDLGIIGEKILWLSGDYKSLFTVIVADSWKVTPLVMLILLAGLQSIDRQLFKAAKIDGAKPFYIFRRITLPLLMPSITAAVIIRGIDAFRIFSLALVLMGENLKVIGTFAYLEFSEYNNQYLSAASALILFLIIMTAVLVYIRFVGKKGLEAT